MRAVTVPEAAGWVGRPVRRVEDRPLVTGRGCYTADLPAAVQVRFVRSSVPAGRLTGIGSDEEGQLFTAADLDGVKPIRPMLHKFGYRPVAQPILADGVVRFVGEPVAAVAAPDAAAAEDLADAVMVDIDETAPVVGLDVALADGAGDVHAAAPGNVVVAGEVETPGLSAAFDAAGAVVSVDMRSHRQSAMPLETRAAHAAWEAATGRVTLTCSTQMPHLTRTAVADLLGMPESDLRVIAPDVGGAFGQKMSLAPEFVFLVWYARRFRTSCAWAEDRRENLMASFHSRDQRVHLDGAFDNDGRLRALSADVGADVGAYSCYPTTAAVEPLMALAELPGPYAFEHYACTARGVLTNTCPMAPYRGVSRPVIALALERLMDEAGRRLRLAPEAIRRRNLVAEHPYTTATGLVLDQATYPETMDLALAAVGPEAFRARQAAARREGRLLGLGVATFAERSGYGTPAFAARGMEVTPGWESADIAMDPSGAVEARIGASPHGQGLATSLAQIVADEIGTRPDRVRIVHGDTDRTPYGWGTFASRSLVICGGATLLASRKLRDKIVAIAAQELEVAEADIVLADGRAGVTGTDRSIAIDEVARSAYHRAHTLTDIEPGLAMSASYDPAGTFSNACHVAIVEVDAETGHVGVERFVVAEDAGRLVNPMIVDGQIRGGVTQGIANALLEEIVYDAEGTILTTSLADYLPPTAAEIPEIEIHHLATETDASVTRAKGLGEGGAIGAPAAVINAVNDALAHLGVAIDECPASPARVRAALRRAMAEPAERGDGDA